MGSTPKGSVHDAHVSCYTLPQHHGTHQKAQVRLAAPAVRRGGFGTCGWTDVGRWNDSDAAPHWRGFQLEEYPAAFGRRRPTRMPSSNPWARSPDGRPPRTVPGPRDPNQGLSGGEAAGRGLDWRVTRARRPAIRNGRKQVRGRTSRSPGGRPTRTVSGSREVEPGGRLTPEARAPGRDGPRAPGPARPTTCPAARKHFVPLPGWTRTCTAAQGRGTGPAAGTAHLCTSTLPGTRLGLDLPRGTWPTPNQELPINPGMDPSKPAGPRDPTTSVPGPASEGTRPTRAGSGPPGPRTSPARKGQTPTTGRDSHFTHRRNNGSAQTSTED